MIDFYEIGDELELEDESYVVFYHNPIDVKSTIMLSIIEEVEDMFSAINFIIIQDYTFKEYAEDNIQDIPTTKIVCCGSTVFKATGIIPKDILISKLKPIIEML